jgi:hypothetical protein
MRLSGLGTLTMGMLLLNRSDSSADEDATTWVTKALNTACGPWISGADRVPVSAKLRRDGWATIDDAEFTQSGRWGAVTVALRAREATRMCEIEMRTDSEPRTTVEAATAAQTWIAACFPGSVRERSTHTVINAELARVSRWSDGSAKITLTVFETKQAAPRADFIFRVECAG